MPTLLESTVNLRELILQLGQASDERARLERLSTRANQIRQAADDLNAVDNAAKLLKGRVGETSSLPKPSVRLRNKTPLLIAALAHDWHAFADSSDIKTTFVDPVITHAQKLRDALLMAWRAHVDAGLPDIREDLLAALTSAGFHIQCAKLRDLRIQIDKLRQALPITESTFDSLENLKADIQHVWSELEGVPLEVVGFLRKASLRQATFAELTPAIHAWLEKRGILTQLRIGLG